MRQPGSPVCPGNCMASGAVQWCRPWEIVEFWKDGNTGIHEWRKYRNTRKKEIKEYMNRGNKGIHE